MPPWIAIKGIFFFTRLLENAILLYTFFFDKDVKGKHGWRDASALRVNCSWRGLSLVQALISGGSKSSSRECDTFFWPLWSHTHKQTHKHINKTRDIFSKGHPQAAPLGNPSHIQSPNPDTIVDANKCLLTGVWYSYVPRGSATFWQIQRRMLAASHWTEHWDHNGGVTERTEGAEGVCNPIIRTTILTNQYPQSSQGLNYQSKSTHGETHGSSCICSRDILRFWAKIHISVSVYHVCSSVIGLPHSGWYFLVLFICLRISWTHSLFYCFNIFC